MSSGEANYGEARVIIADEDGMLLDWTRGVGVDYAGEAAARAASLLRLMRDEAWPLVGDVVEVTIKGSRGVMKIIWDPPFVRASIEG